tara:strand:- start:1618 stop:1941 length:324 start_codon:yes stop_codon:yes gene_type:complete
MTRNKFIEKAVSKAKERSRMRPLNDSCWYGVGKYVTHPTKELWLVEDEETALKMWLAGEFTCNLKGRDRFRCRCYGCRKRRSIDSAGRYAKKKAEAQWWAQPRVPIK